MAKSKTKSKLNPVFKQVNALLEAAKKKNNDFKFLFLAVDPASMIQTNIAMSKATLAEILINEPEVEAFIGESLAGVMLHKMLGKAKK